MVSYIAQTRQSVATAGNNILFGGGEMWSARHYSIQVPSQGQQHHALDALNMCQSLSTFHALHVLTEHALACDDRLADSPLYIFY